MDLGTRSIGVLPTSPLANHNISSCRQAAIRIELFLQIVFVVAIIGTVWTLLKPVFGSVFWCFFFNWSTLSVLRFICIFNWLTFLELVYWRSDILVCKMYSEMFSQIWA